MSVHDVAFDAMGSEVRIVIDEPGDGASGVPEPALAIAAARRYIAAFEQALSRFRPDSELCALNRDPRPEVPASPLMREAVRAGLWAARRTGGLVDPTLLRALEAAGYVKSRAGVAGAPLAEALAVAPARRPAQPHPGRAWARFEVDDAAGLIKRPPGIPFDTGGCGKGLAADLVASRLRGYHRFVVDCGGDIRVGGRGVTSQPFAVHVQHPVSRRHVCVIHSRGGGIATSGLDVRIWRRKDGSFAHHLIDPATLEPAWTGLVGATALGRTALEAETLSKAALLSGPQRGRTVLAELGGILVHESGRIELCGPLAFSPRFQLPPTHAGVAA